MKIDIEAFKKPCACGHKHDVVVEDIIIEKGAVEKLPEIMKRTSFADKKNVVMLCDENTYEAAGRKVAELLPGIKTIMLDSRDLHANEKGVGEAKLGLNRVGAVDLMIAVGSGTIHDITRYHAYNMGIDFISVPTAASVDGYVSTVAAMTWNGCKKSFTAVSPLVVVADTDIYSKAPLRLTASGVSDLLGKYTALADWKIAHLVTGEYICNEICQLEYQALDSLVASLPGLVSGDAKSYEDLMYGLLLSGIAMQMTGNSRPASGAEHHMSHLWEMEVINDYIPFYHGEKVGVGLVLASKIYHKAAEKLLAGPCEVKESVPLEEELIRANFKRPEMLETILLENTPNLLDNVKPERLMECREEIAKILQTVPEAEKLIAMIEQVKGVKSLADLGFEQDHQAKTAKLSPYVRARLTFMRLMKFYNFYEEAISC